MGNPTGFLEIEKKKEIMKIPKIDLNILKNLLFH